MVYTLVNTGFFLDKISSFHFADSVAEILVFLQLKVLSTAAKNEVASALFV